MQKIFCLRNFFSEGERRKREKIGHIALFLALISAFPGFRVLVQEKAPVLHVKSGDTVEIETLITSSPKRLEDAGAAPAQVKQSLRDITEQVKDKGPGGHILTGPIYVDGAGIGMESV